MMSRRGWKVALWLAVPAILVVLLLLAKARAQEPIVEAPSVTVKGAHLAVKANVRRAIIAPAWWDDESSRLTILSAQIEMGDGQPTALSIRSRMSGRERINAEIFGRRIAFATLVPQGPSSLPTSGTLTLHLGIADTSTAFSPDDTPALDTPHLGHVNGTNTLYPLLWEGDASVALPAR